MYLETLYKTMNANAPHQSTPHSSKRSRQEKKAEPRLSIGLSTVSNQVHLPPLEEDALPSPQKAPSNLRLWILCGLLALSIIVAALSWFSLKQEEANSLEHLFKSYSQEEQSVSSPAQTPPEPAYDLQAVEQEEEALPPVTYPESVLARTLGRSNPFDPIQPLIIEAETTSDEDLAPSEEELIEYIGIISGDTPEDSVAIIHRLDEPDGSTKLIEVGDNFSINGESVLVLKITENTLTVRVKGAKKTINLREYIDSVATETEEDDTNPTNNNPSSRFNRRNNNPTQFINQR